MPSARPRRRSPVPAETRIDSSRQIATIRAESGRPPHSAEFAAREPPDRSPANTSPRNSNARNTVSNQSDPENFIYIIRVAGGYAHSLEMGGYDEEEVNTDDPLPDGWYRAIAPEFKQDATEYPPLDDEIEFEPIGDPTRPRDWTTDL